MAFSLQAPYPGLRVTTLLPNPLLGNSVSPAGSLDTKRAKDGTKYIYVKSRDQRRKYLWTFSLSKDKVFELQAFFDAFNSNDIKIIDHDGIQYVGNFTTNPFEFESVRRSIASPGDFSINQIQIEFEGFEQTP